MAAESLYDVGNISVDTTANNAVAARASGMAEAQRKAFKVVLQRLVPASVLNQLPEFGQQQVEGMVSGLSIRKEQNSTTRYIATLDVSFSPQAVQQLLVNQGIPYSENRAPSISILPVVLAGGSLQDSWRQAWETIDVSHSVTPARVLRPRQDVDANTLKGALAGDSQALGAMQEAYGYGPLVIAVGEVAGGNFVTRLVGTDGIGEVNVNRSDPIGGGGARKAAQDAAAAAFVVLESRWMELQSGGVPPVDANYQEGLPPEGGQPPADGQSEVPRNVAAMVEFSGLKDWQQIRSRLTRVAGLQALEVNSLSARTASITFDFAGSLDRLQAELGQNGFALDEKDGVFVLRSR